MRKEDVLVSQPIGTEAFGEDTQCLVCKCAGQAFHKFLLPAPFKPPPKSIFFLYLMDVGFAASFEYQNKMTLLGRIYTPTPESAFKATVYE